jgi:hypothetical protein
MLLTLFLFIFAIGLGHRLIRGVVETWSWPERIAFSGALGLGIFAYGILGLGLLGGLKWPLWAFTATFILLSLPETLRLAREIKTPRPTLSGILIGLGLLVFGVITLLGVISPADSSEWDTIAYHLAVPKLYLEAGRIYYIPYIHHSNFPSTVEMLYTWGLAINGQSAAKAFHWLFGWMMFLGAAGFAVRQSNGKATGFAMLGLAATPIVLWEAGTGYVDLATGCYAALAVFATYDGLTNRRICPIILAGLMAGLAVGTKSTALLLLVLLSLLVLIWNIRNAPKESIKFAATLGLIGILVASPWFVKTYVYTGNPVYPFFYSVFGGRNWNEVNAAQYSEEQKSFGVGATIEERQSLKAFLMLPWNLAAYVPEGQITRNYGFTNVGTPFAQIGALWCFLLLAIPFLRLPKPTAFLLLVVGGMTLGWFFLSQQSRYLLMILPLLASLFGMIAAQEKPWFRWLAGILIAFQALILLMGFIPFFTTRQALAVIGGITQEEYLEGSEGELIDASRFINDRPFTSDMLPNSKILLIDEVRGFYFDRPYVWGNPGHHTLIPYDSFKNAKDLIDFLKKNGYTDVLLNKQWGSGFQGDPWRKLFSEAEQQSYLRQEYQGRSIAIYHIDR